MRRMSYKNRRDYAAEILEAAFFGAILTAIGVRKKEQSLTRSQIGFRMGREKTGISKLLSGPRNWQIRTISDLAEALDLRLQFSFVDRNFPIRKFTATGIQYGIVPQTNWLSVGNETLPGDANKVLGQPNIISGLIPFNGSPPSQKLLEAPLVPSG
jgi:DNA-binding phage protein